MLYINGPKTQLVDFPLLIPGLLNNILRDIYRISHEFHGECYSLVMGLINIFFYHLPNPEWFRYLVNSLGIQLI